MAITKLEYEDLFENGEGEPTEPFEELLKKINEIIDEVNE